ncbi:cytochrome c oxidase subunit 4 [Aeromicrobium camelliae]|uniref:Cytochrome c oxidase polypeptide 4 n=1 Tax=Aeromicrobium camelliae TaxID=1538144 RepID=A0A3N6WP68_9ACTN|nr:cytochrome c oxidase subunit 4 [Aeromicrobium camelliae]RQN03143.1 cytochrome c oxidase subunit 4 [Aeromicrobium camelliae]
MKNEFWILAGCAVFFVFVTPTYWVLSGDPTGTTALTMTLLLCLMLVLYLGFVSKQVHPRPEDRKDGDIIDGAGELGFFPPFSWWPLWAAMVFGVLMLGIVVGWWLFLLAVPFGAVVVVGWVFEYYRGVHAH